MFGIGIFELVILLAIFGIMIGIPLVVVFVALAFSRRPTSISEPAPADLENPFATPLTTGQQATGPVSSLAVASLVLSSISIVLGPFGFLPGIVCGHLARAAIRRDSSIGGHPLATAGLIIGYLFLGFFVLSVASFALLAVRVVEEEWRFGGYAVQ